MTQAKIAGYFPNLKVVASALIIAANFADHFDSVFLCSVMTYDNP
jgi:hypothetical protein